MYTPGDPHDPTLWSVSGGDDGFQQVPVFSVIGELKVEIEECLDFFAGSHRTVEETIDQLQAISDHLARTAAESRSELLAQASDGLTQVLQELDHALVNLAEVHQYGVAYLRSLG